MKRTPSRCRRAHYALAKLPVLVVAVWLVSIEVTVGLLLLKRFCSAARSFPFRFVLGYAVTYVIIALTVVPDLNWPRVLVMQAGAFAIMVTAYGAANIVRQRAMSGGGS